MSGRDRNAPCPCGSGQKYKKCCLGKTEALPRYTQADETSMREWLSSLPEAEAVQAEHFADLPANLFEDEFTGTVALGALQAHLACDVLNDPAHPQHAELTARLADHEPSAGERGFLAQCAGATLRPYRVVELHRGHGATLLDLLQETTVRIYEPALGHADMAGANLMARVVSRGPSGQPEVLMPWLPIPAPPADSEDVWFFDEVRNDFAAHAEMNPELAKADPTALVDAFCRGLSASAFRAWYTIIFGEPAQDLRTPDGEPVEDVDVVFEVVAAEGLSAALDARSDLRRAGDDWEWLSDLPADAESGPVALAWLRLEPDRLLVQCIARAHAERLQALLTAELSSHLRYLETIGAEDEWAGSDAGDTPDGDADAPV